MKNIFHFLVIFSLVTLSSCIFIPTQIGKRQTNVVEFKSSLADLKWNSPWIEPYSPLNGGTFSGQNISDSPDPLVGYQWNSNVDISRLQVYFLLPVNVSTNSPSSFDNLQSLTQNIANVTVKGTGSIFMDFGVESAAWLEFDSPDSDLSATILMSISEYNQPAIVNAGVDFPHKTTVPIKYGDTYRLELNSDLYEGVRFGWIHIVQTNRNKTWHITAVRKVCQIKPTNYLGTFQASDPILTKIWYTAVYTVKLNLLSDFFGAILMDRGDRISWTGDAHASQAASLVAFANFDSIKQNIENSKEESNGIKAYSLYWILSVVDYYQYTNDKDSFLIWLPFINDILNDGFNVYNSSENLSFMGGDERLGDYFEEPNGIYARQTYNMLFLRALNNLVPILLDVNDRSLAAFYEAQFNKLVSQLRSDSRWYENLDIHSASYAINAGFTSPQEKYAMDALYFSDPVQLTSFTPFINYFILQALGHLQQQAKALNNIYLLWGGQLQAGATSFYETFSPQWNAFMQPNDPPPNGQNGYTSECHPWAAGVAKWLTEEYLGIKPSKPGFSEISIIPSYLADSVSGQISTLKGRIFVDFNSEKGTFIISKPSNTPTLVGIPKTKPISEILLNGNTISLKSNLHQDEHYIYLHDLMESDYKIQIVYQNVKQAPTKMEDPTYDAKFLGSDNNTQGNWFTRYGEDGFIFFSYLNNGIDQVSLPSYVQSYGIRNGGVGTPLQLQWDPNTTDIRALENINVYNRAIGRLQTQNPQACQQTFPLDIILNPPFENWIKFSLYFVDWTRSNRSLVIEIFDYETKRIISPWIKLENFNEGVYLSWAYNKSIRFRISFVRGEDAILSAIFFDSILKK